MKMKTMIVCGSRDRDLTHGEEMLWHGVLDLLRPDVVLHGDCRGVDRHAARLAARWGYAVEPRPANWAMHGKAAGPIRNRGMVVEAVGGGACTVFDGGTGTADMAGRARTAGLQMIDLRTKRVKEAG